MYKSVGALNGTAAYMLASAGYIKNLIFGVRWLPTGPFFMEMPENQIAVSFSAYRKYGANLCPSGPGA
jgi:hypothetical protein